jgi:predicted aspartyl protease
MQEVGELPVVLYQGMPTVDAQINGQPVRMLIDTGSDATLLFRSGAAQLRLALRRLVGVRFFGVGGGDDAQLARVESLRISNLSLKDSDLIVVGRNDMGPVQGVVGARFLTQVDVEFDIPGGKIRFFRPKGCSGDQVVYWGAAYAVTPLRPSTDYGLHVTVMINGQAIDAEMDSGAGLSTLTPAGAAKAGMARPNPDAKSDGYITGVGPQKVAESVATFQTFAFGDETIHNAKLRVADMFGAAKVIPIDSRIPVAAVDEPRMLLGADFFRSHRIYVSIGQKRIYASYVGGPVFDLTARRPETPAQSTPAN